MTGGGQSQLAALALALGALLVVILLSAVTAAGAAGTLTAGQRPPGDTAPAPNDPTSPSSGPGGEGSGGSAPGPGAASIPADMLALYTAAAPTCPGLDWSVLAGIGSVETHHGRSRLPGVQSGENSAGAAGYMQFLEPTFDSVVARHRLPPHPGPPSRYNPSDAVYAAAAYLCDSGAGRPNGLRKAIWTYNHSDAYVNLVLARAAAYRASPAPRPAPAPPAAPGGPALAPAPRR